MSPGRRPSAVDAGSSDRLFITPGERRQAMLDIISSARSRLVLSLFRCNEFATLDALAGALERGVKVEAILTKRAKGGKKRLRKLWAALEEMGAVVHRYGDPVVKYHAKYLVADGKTALVTTLNPTRKCFTRTWDFVLTTEERTVVRSLSTLFALDAAGQRVLPRHRISPRLIVGPEGARLRIHEMLASARHSIQVLDHKLSDPDLVALLREQRNKGIAVSVVGRQPMGPLVPHGKLFIVDGSRAVLGSTAMSALSLDFRREVSIVVDAPHVVRRLNEYYKELSERAGESVWILPGDRAA
jgi:cardiolipin synthase A/B